MAGASKVGARLDRLAISGFHWRLLFLVGSGMFLDGFEVYLAGGVVGLLIKTGWTDLAGSAKFVSAGVLGMVAGAWLAGVLGDRFGRRFSYQLNLLVFGLASFAAAASPSMAFLILARLVMGVGLGAEIVVGYGTLIEFIPSRHRGRWGAGLSLFMNGALFVSSLAGYFILPRIGWRWLFVGVGACAIFIWILRKNMPESPRWLESRGRLADAELVVDAIERESKIDPHHRSEMPAPSHKTPPDGGGQYSLLAPNMIRRLVVGLMLNIGGNAAVYGFFAWVPTFLMKQGMEVTASLGFTALMSFGAPVGAVVGMLISDRVDRRSSLAFLSLLSAILGAIYPFVANTTALTAVGFALVTTVYVFVSIGWASYVPELFPTEIRLRAAGLCNAGGRIAATALPFIVVALLQRFGVGAVAALLSGILVLQAIVVIALGITTNHRGLEALSSDAG